MKLQLEINPKKWYVKLIEYIQSKLQEKRQKRKLKLLQIWTENLVKLLGTDELPPTLFNVSFVLPSRWVSFYRVEHNLTHQTLAWIRDYDVHVDRLAILNTLLSSRALKMDAKTKKLIVYTETTIQYYEVIGCGVDRGEAVLVIQTPTNQLTYSFRHMKELLPFIAEELMYWSKT